MKYLAYKISPNISGWLRGPKNISQPQNNSIMDYQQHKPARNPVAAPEYSPKQNFATSPKRNFDHVNCSEDQSRASSTKPVSGPG